ncbi:MAG: sulfatase [Verrucomicrobium sp.]|nr:sulfatase [Verrucomicrobium sp.]
MKLRNLLPGAVLSLVTAGTLPAATGTTAAPPNVVVIFADDMGYGDLGTYGARKWKTPHLDRMAAEGVRFERFYVAQPVCSASRMALMTGCYPNRVGIRGALGPGAKVGISENEMTLAEVLKPQGYATAAFGKWHLGDAPQFLPTHHGFDEYLGLPYSNDMWPLHPEVLNRTAGQKQQGRMYPSLPLIDGDQVALPEVSAVEQTRLTTWYTQRAVNFIKGHKESPFFLYLAHSMPHVPLYVSDKYQGKSEGGVYGDVIEEIDWSVGEVLRTLKEQGLDDNTLVIFTSDNGPWLSYGSHGGSPGPLREGKGTVWEGGVREPFVARWPGKIPAGNIVKEPAMTIDLLPTIAGLAKARLPESKIDGRDIWPLLSAQAGAKSPHDAYFFYYNDNELQAVMSGPWKLYFPHAYRTLNGRAGGENGMPAKYEQGKVEKLELYHVESDLGEKTDVAGQHPEIMERLQKLAEGMRDDLGDSLTKRPASGARLPGRID